ncbi:MAG: endonuclease/exonuclease/phosphatase family protein [Planctomycetota bacterium]
MSIRLLSIACACLVAAGNAAADDGRIRVATFNVEDLRVNDFLEPGPRVDALAAIIQQLDADILLLNEVEVQEIRRMVPMQPGERQELGETVMYFSAGKLLAERVAAEAQCDGCTPINYVAYVHATNTGKPSGFDLDNDGLVDETPGDPTYGGDALGWGTIPGQYGMTLLVREGIEILESDVRTFQTFLWKDMPGALLPPGVAADGTVDPASTWYAEEELDVVRLSSKSHWDVPVRLPDGRVLHLLCSHPTPPVFDGPEDRNGRRNHDEIRFIGEYIDGADWIVDDTGGRGGLAPDASFVILGDLNADPTRRSERMPMRRWLLGNDRVNAEVVPTSDLEVEGLEPVDTARFRLRVDYALPSSDLAVVGSGIWRRAPGEFPSDHYPIWIDLAPVGD